MTDPGIRLLSLSGELDVLTERRLRPDLSEVVGDRSREIVVDLRSVTFIDSSSLAILLHTHNQLERQGRALACVVGEGPVQRILDVSGLTRDLHLFATVEDATDFVLRARPAPA